MVLGGICCGLIADKWHCHRTVITLACLVSLIAVTTQPAVSVYYGNPVTNQCPTPIIDAIQSHLISNDKNSSSNFRSEPVDCNNDTKLLTMQLNCSNTNLNLSRNYNSQTLYIIMFLINFCFSFSEGSSVAFIDSGALRRSQLAPDNRPIQYGRQRMFAAAGAICGILFSNLSVDFFPANTTITCYAGIFIAYGMFTVLYGVFTILSYRGLSFREVKEKEDKESGNHATDTNKEENANSVPCHEEKEITELWKDTDNEIKDNEFHQTNKSNFWRIFIKTFFQCDTMFFYLTTLVSGLEYSQFTSFLFVYLKEMHAPSILLTLAIVFSGIVSAICFAYAHTIIRLLGGKWRAIPFSFLVYFVRYLGISLIRNPWLVLIFQPLHALSATLFVATGLMHLKETSPLPVLTTMVSIFNGIHYGLGTVIGSSISGVIYQRFGGRVLFRSTALLSIVWFFVLLVYVFFKEKTERKKNPANGLDGEDLLETPFDEEKL